MCGWLLRDDDTTAGAEAGWLRVPPAMIKRRPRGAAAPQNDHFPSDAASWMQQQFRSQFNAAGFYKSDDNFVALHIDDATLLKITSSFVCSSPYMTFYKNVT